MTSIARHWIKGGFIPIRGIDYKTFQRKGGKDMTLKKTVNVSNVKYAILNESGNMVERELKFPRKLSQTAAIREIKKIETGLIQMTVKVKCEKQTITIPFDPNH